MPKDISDIHDLVVCVQFPDGTFERRRYRDYGKNFYSMEAYWQRNNPGGSVERIDKKAPNPVGVLEQWEGLEEN